MKLLLIVTLTVATLAAEKLTYTYDEAGRLARVESDAGRVITYAYDASGNLVKRMVTGNPPPSAAAAKADGKKKAK